MRKQYDRRESQSHHQCVHCGGSLLFFYRLRIELCIWKFEFSLILVYFPNSSLCQRHSSATHVHCGSKTQSDDYLPTVLGTFYENRIDFLHRYMTRDETWIHHCTSDSKQQSTQWIEADSSAPKEVKTGAIGGNGCGVGFFDMRKEL